jgi:hypothetical protein
VAMGCLLGWVMSALWLCLACYGISCCIQPTSWAVPPRVLCPGPELLLILKEGGAVLSPLPFNKKYLSFKSLLSC